MKVYQYRGKKPLEEIHHIESLLGDLWRGYHAYDPEHTDQNTSIVLHLLSKEEEKQQNEEYRNGVSPSLLTRRWRKVQDILKKDGYEVEER